MPTTAAFESLYRTLNRSQREAVDAIEGPVMVIAGPGTGKTSVLTLRIANILMKTDTPPEAVLALTFTESGAAEMKGRLADIIGTDAYRVEVTTFHSFCNGIIREFPECFGPLAGAASITEPDQAVTLQELIDTTDGVALLRPPNAPDLYLRAVIASVNRLKQEGVPPERLAEICDATERDILSSDDLKHAKGAHRGAVKGVYAEQLKGIAKLRELTVLYRAYQERLRAEGLYDYADMVMETARVLDADRDLLLLLQERHQYLHVDEHQDTNNAQNRIIELLASFWERPNLFIVGDAKQAIYRFQGASLENFEYFRTRYPDTRLIELRQNYRSSQLILDAAEGVRASDGRPLEARSGHEDAPIDVLAFSAPDVQYWSVTQHIRQRLEQGTRPDEIAVLARDNADAVAVTEFLRKASVPFSLSTQQDLMADPYLSQLVLILEAVRQFGAAGPLMDALHTPVLGIDPLDCYKLAGFCRDGRNPYDVMRSPALMHEAGIDDADALRTLAGRMGGWATLAVQPQAAEALETLIRESGVLTAVVRDPDAPDALARLHALYDMLRSRVQRDRSTTLASFAAHLAFLRERGIPMTSLSGTPLPGRIRVMTAHKSKGLEFDFVYLIDAVDGHWGARVRRDLLKLPADVFVSSGRPRPESGADDDERNLFYVALTRARREVVITFPQRERDGSDLLPARFIADIRPSLVRHADTAGFEDGYRRAGATRYEAGMERKPQSRDVEYLNGLFTRYGLSVTALNNYLACPWRYFYTSLLRIPEAPSFALMYGNAVDRALQEYFDRYVAGTIGSREDLIGLFEGFLRHQPLQAAELESGLVRGRAALEGYYDRYHADWHPRIINQLRIPAITLEDGTLLNGRIDKVELLDASGAVRVIDYKTGTPKTRNQIAGAVKDGDGNYLRQLTFYRLLLDRFQDRKYRVTEGVIDFIEPDAKGRWHREAFTISDRAVRDLATTIHTVASEIRALAFWDRRCGERECAYCALRNIMESRNG